MKGCPDCEKHYAYIDELEAENKALRAVSADTLIDYDAGSLNDYGGGNVDWWFDYIRKIIADANEHWREHIRAVLDAAEQQP